MEAIKKILRTPSAFVLFLVAVVSLIGIIIQSNTDKEIARMPIDATSTAEARLTEAVNISSLTQLAILPSATPYPLLTFTETETLTPTLTTTDSIAPGNILLQDDFIDNRNDWLLLDTQFIKSNILGGKYKHTINCPKEYEAFYCGHYFLVPNLVHKDFQFEIESALIEVSPSNAEVMIAFQFRRNNNNYYDVYFRNIGMYTVNISNNGSLNKLLENTALDGFNQNLNTTNRYGFSAVNSTITPIFNGTQLLTVEDGNLNQAGSVYLVIFVARGSSAIIEMDNLLVIDRSAY
ncbi:MAG: hypothetical protein HND47_20640 [Chloroflexi bacterium]|nr:hypothetical protein [Chloroflexota bacterium]